MNNLGNKTLPQEKTPPQSPTQTKLKHKTDVANIASGVLVWLRNQMFCKLKPNSGVDIIIIIIIAKY